MKVYCKECNTELSKDLTELTDINLLNEEDGNDFLPKGYIFNSDGEYFRGTEGKLIINLTDSLETTNHPDFKRLNGCCGLDGMDGLNKVCADGHEFGTAKEDCWMPHCLILETSKIQLR